MSILAHVTSSTARTGIRVVIAGVEGIGKTTLACNAPRALLVPLEQGFSGVQVQKVPMLEHFDHVLMLLDEITASVQAQQFIYQSLIFDSATALERMIHQAVLATDPIYQKGNKKGLIMDNALGGYGKAYNLANDRYDEFLKKCDVLVELGINIVMTCHVFSSKIKDPTVGEYASWDLRLHSPKNDKTYGKREMTTQWADVVGFLHEPLFVTGADDKTGMARAISQNKGRVLAINRAPSYVAKNRFGVVNDIALPKDGGWNMFAKELYDAKGIDVFNRD
jgi:hypothetical protein